MGKTIAVTGASSGFGAMTVRELANAGHTVAVQIARVVDLPKGKRPFRVHIDPSDDGAEAVNAVGDEIRKLFCQRIDLGDLLQPASQGAQ
jgi:NAD(P)-dependent dehydrogenase (short-subunit alcohol dehydrogenase family)